MPTPETVLHHLARSALNDVSTEAEGWLNSPKPPAGATDYYATRWYRKWCRILLLDLKLFPGVVIPFEGAAEVLGCDVAMIEAALAQLRRDDDEEPPLTEADFARVAKSN
jgi:hypothetical protein